MRDIEVTKEDIKKFWQFMKDTNPDFQAQLKNADRIGCVVTVNNEQRENILPSGHYD